MIAALRGRLQSLAGETALIDVGGIVLQVLVTRRAAETFQETGASVYVHTYLHLRDDAVSLYGFADPAERELFLKLLTVTGIGPRLACAVLSALERDRLHHAVESEDPTLLAGVPGVGKRIASRIVVELKGKLGRMSAAPFVTGRGAALEQVQVALEQLGYTGAEVQSALAALPPSSLTDAQSAVRASLEYLSERSHPRGR